MNAAMFRRLYHAEWLLSAQVRAARGVVQSGKACPGHGRRVDGEPRFRRLVRVASYSSTGAPLPSRPHPRAPLPSRCCLSLCASACVCTGTRVRTRLRTSIRWAQALPALRIACACAHMGTLFGGWVRRVLLCAGHVTGRMLSTPSNPAASAWFTRTLGGTTESYESTFARGSD